MRRCRSLSAMKRLAALVISALTLTTALSSTQASAPLAAVSSPVDVFSVAHAEFTATEVVRVAQTSVLSLDVYGRATAAADTARAAWSASRGASVPMERVMRGGDVVQEPEIAGFHLPMNVTVLPTQAMAALMGRDVAAVVARGEIVMGANTAALRGARVGDTVDLVSVAGSVERFTIGMLAADSIIGGTELLLSPLQGDRIGVVNVTSIVIWGFPSRESIDSALAEFGLEPRADTRVRRSWDAFDPDFNLSMTQTKALMGEFAYRVRPNGIDVDVTPTWVATSMAQNKEPYSTGINARCNNVVRADLEAALAEVVNSGLRSQIDVANANKYGGCYYPRFNRVTGNLGFLSRHSWGAPLDTNTTTNAQGAVPQMDCDVVRIFRKHNFAWGGNFLTPDGMHFEWVGERRDLFQYPSRYCANLPVPVSIASVTRIAAILDSTHTTRATLFQDDGWGAGE